jgi:hypothetical protein
MMENFWLGFKAMFQIWSDADFAKKVSALLVAGVIEPAKVSETVAAPVLVKTPARSEALTLLSVLQREGRLVDFLKEPIASYTDAQIGAAVRGVHEDCGKVLDRLFAIEPLRTENEGEPITIPGGFDPAQVRLVGSIPDQGPFKGALQHAGWRASKAELPEWKGREGSALVIAPCEVEVK